MYKKNIIFDTLMLILSEYILFMKKATISKINNNNSLQSLISEVAQYHTIT